MCNLDPTDEAPRNDTQTWAHVLGAPLLKTFAFYIEDDRYSVPTLNIVTMTDEARAWEWAQGAMRENPHYLGVEVCEDGERLFGLGSLADRARSE